MTYIKLQWVIVFSIVAVDLIWLSFSSFLLQYDFYVLIAISSVVLFLFSLYLIFLKSSFEMLKKILLSFCWLIVFNNAGMILSYLVNTFNRPLITSSLANMDSYLNFYTPTLISWFSNHHGLSLIFAWIYSSLLFQNVFTLLLLSTPGKTVYLESYMMQYMIAAVLTIIICAVFPAVGTYAWYNLPTTPDQLSDLERLYELRRHIVALGKANGIATFPSFHTAAAVLITYAFRHQSTFLFIPILTLNMLMIFSCLSHGGHFLVDIFGGIGVAVFAIGMEQVLFRNLQFFSFKKTKNEKEISQVPEFINS